MLYRKIFINNKNAGDKTYRQRRKKKKKVFFNILIHGKLKGKNYFSGILEFIS